MKDEYYGPYNRSVDIVRDHHRFVIEHIDGTYHEGYAEQHPELVGAYLTSLATIYGAALHAEWLSDRLANVSEALETIAGTIEAKAE